MASVQAFASDVAEAPEHKTKRITLSVTLAVALLGGAYSLGGWVSSASEVKANQEKILDKLDKLSTTVNKLDRDVGILSTRVDNLAK